MHCSESLQFALQSLPDNGVFDGNCDARFRRRSPRKGPGGVKLSRLISLRGRYDERGINLTDTGRGKPIL